MNEEDLTGKTIQGYFVQKPIGQGKFATVYKAETEDKRIVALKKIRIFEMNDPRLRDKCLKEVRLMQQLEHPNIIKYLDSFIVNNELIIITEWAEKGDLKKVLKTAITAEVPIEEPKIWEYMNQIALALKHMHDKRIMHRDLKPANIFLSNEDILKVGDFGLGRVFSEETVEAYSKVGTPLYMSPELLVGQGYDMKSDVWSLGCIVYEMCEQKSPFRNDNEKMSLMDLFNNITKGEYKPVSHRFSEELRTTIHDMIVVDPQKRCDTNRVIEACQNWREKQKHSLKIDCLIVMEDVLEKLNLLEYRKNFCIPRNLKPISKTYFAISESAVDKQEKFKYFIQLSYWLIGLIQEVRKQGNKAPVIGKPKLDEDPKVVAKKLLDDLTSIDTPFNKQITPENLSQGTDEAVCYVLNELINKRLILTNFQFLQPKFNNADADDEELAEDYGIRELDPSKVFTSDQKGLPTESDDDEDKGNKEYLQTINTTYHSNSTSATSTYTDQMYKFTKRPTPGGGLEDDMIINEDGMMELDSVEWNKEVDRVTKELDDLTQKLDGGDAISVIQTSDERIYHLEGLKKYNANIKSYLHNIGKHPWQKKIQDWNDTIQTLRKGEKVLNDTTAQLTDDFKNLVSEKGNVYQQLQSQTKLMKDKVETLEQTTQKLKNIREVIAEKEKLMFGADRKIEIQKGIQNLKVELKQMDVKAEIMKGLLLRYEVEGREKTREHQGSFNEVEGI